MIRLSMVVVSVVVLVGCKQQVQCPAKYADLAPGLKASGGECACPVGRGSGSVWGAGVYTGDSDLCRAAVHAGALNPEKGGTVKFKGAPGCGRYAGTEKNGVTSAKWKAFGNSFYFPGFGEPACVSSVPNECPGSFNAIENIEKLQTFSCACDLPPEGSVWGTHVYTADSSICGAAVHASVVHAAGDKVTVRAAPGCAKYLGSVRNGVSTTAYGPFASSFFFEGHGDGACPEVPADLCPSTFLQIPDSEKVTRFSCTCTNDPNGSVWGTDLYTRDSSLCGAAIHAGVLPDHAGKISVRAEKPCQKYVGSERNGVSSDNWAAFEGGSFAFEGAKPGRCAE